MCDCNSSVRLCTFDPLAWMVSSLSFISYTKYSEYVKAARITHSQNIYLDRYVYTNRHTSTKIVGKIPDTVCDALDVLLIITQSEMH